MVYFYIKIYQKNGSDEKRFGTTYIYICYIPYSVYK